MLGVRAGQQHLFVESLDLSDASGVNRRGDVRIERLIERGPVEQLLSFGAGRTGVADRRDIRADGNAPLDLGRGEERMHVVSPPAKAHAARGELHVLPWYLNHGAE